LHTQGAHIFRCNDEDGTLDYPSNAMFSLKRVSDSLTQKWKLEGIGKDVLDGKSLKYAYGSSSLDDAKLIYVGQDQYVIQKNGKNLNHYAVEGYLTKNEAGEVVEKLRYKRTDFTLEFKTANYNDEFQRFAIKKMEGFYYICPYRIRTTGVTSDCTNNWLNKTLTKQRFYVK